MGKDILVEVAKSTQSDIILFFIIVAVVLLAILVPLYKIVNAGREKRLEQYVKREQILIGVVSDNSSVISKLSTLIENNNRNCDACKIEQTSSIDRLVTEQAELKSSVDIVVAIIKDRNQTNK